MIIRPKLLLEYECTELIELARPLLREDFRPTRSEGRRGAKLPFGSAGGIGRYLMRTAADLALAPFSHVEDIEIVEYATGCGYPLHGDLPWRTHTLLVYLSDNYQGGRTVFPDSYGEIEPARGLGVFWQNSKDGRELPEMRHRVDPVTAGTKYVAVVWVWDRVVDRNLLSGQRPPDIMETSAPSDISG